LRPGRLRKCSTYQPVALGFSQPSEHQDLGTSHSPESLTLDGGLRPRCSDERRPDSYTVKPDRGALPVECPVAECARRATSPGCRSGTFRTPHVPMGRDVFRKAVGRRDRPSRAPVRKAHPSGRAVFDQSAVADRRRWRGAGAADCQRGHSTGSAPREAHAEAGGSSWIPFTAQQPAVCGTTRHPQSDGRVGSLYSGSGATVRASGVSDLRHGCEPSPGRHS